MKGFKQNIEKEAVENTDFRRVLYTSKYSQLVLMSLRPLEEIGLEIHRGSDQFFRIEKGNGKCIIDGNEYELSESDAVVVPTGAKHNIVNVSDTVDLKLIPSIRRRTTKTELSEQRSTMPRRSPKSLKAVQRRSCHSAIPAALINCMKPVQARENDNVALTITEPFVELQPGNEALVIQKRSKNWSKWIIRSVVLIFVVLASLSVFLFTQRAVQVAVIQPTQSLITETITSSGRVGGVTETNAGAQTQGIVQTLYVGEGSVVVAGQRLALIKNDVAEAQITQARASVNTARTQLEQVSRGALASDIDAAMQQVRQTQAVVEQQNAAISQAQQNVLQTRSLLAQIEAERDLAKKELDRSTSLLKAGVVSRAEYDQTNTAHLVAVKRVAAQNQAIALAQAGVRSAQASVKSAQANVRTQQARLKTVQLGARPEDVSVARRRISEAENALSVAQRQAANARVVAPFGGTVTKINTQIGQTVGAAGVLTIVSSQLEIHLDVDESNLSSLNVGQEAVISSGAFGGSSFRGTVSQLGAAVDQTRGTIEIKVIPDEPPDWLRPGQTVDVNIITAENVSRLLVPESALTRSGDETVVFVIEEGKIAKKAVITGPPTKEGVPVISGLNSEDFIIADTANLRLGDKVQVK